MLETFLSLHGYCQTQWELLLNPRSFVGQSVTGPAGMGRPFLLLDVQSEHDDEIRWESGEPLCEGQVRWLESPIQGRQRLRRIRRDAVVLPCPGANASLA